MSLMQTAHSTTQDQAKARTTTTEPNLLSYNLFYVVPELVDLYWEKFDFSKALTHTHMTTDDLKNLIKTRQCDLFLAKKGMDIYGGLVVGVYPSWCGLVLELIAASGHGMNEWVDSLYPQIENIAKRCGCHRIMMTGRKGWSKVLNKFDFIEKSITYEKVL